MSDLSQRVSASHPGSTINTRANTRKEKARMPSEAERIANEIMDRHGFGKLPSQPSSADSQVMVSGRGPELGPDFVNERYMEFERPSRHRYR